MTGRHWSQLGPWLRSLQMSGFSSKEIAELCYLGKTGKLAEKSLQESMVFCMGTSGWCAKELSLEAW